MKKTLYLSLLVIMSCLILFPAAWAQEQKTPEPPKADAKKADTPEIDPKDMVDFSKQVEMFTQIAAYAETKKDPILMVGAVRMLDSLPFDGVAKPGAQDKDAMYDRASLLKQAKQYASGDKEMLALIAKFEEVPEKTAVRYGGHRPPPDSYGYYPHGPRHHCNWHKVCGHWGCEWVCRGRGWR